MPANLNLSPAERAVLETAVVGIAGAGGLGSNCAAHLVRAGVRRLVIADFDTVAPGNLNRQFFFRDQIGCRKVEALKENLLRIEPDLELEMHDLRIDGDNIHALFASCAVVAEAFDAAAAKTMLLRELLPTGKTVVSVSGIAGWGRSGALKLRRVGANLILIGDLERGVDPGSHLYPASPRVGIAAAMQANSIVATLLKQEL
ncbi:hypothetical protein SDC9_102540 [bioreactor metagenome]|uniref:THIF-type NAD/FAD binding fold domain-containing protein n=1 Tax=bioreactor metagenome TaxID=1076179 RepID=A0A645AY00_9ZZZZ